MQTAVAVLLCAFKDGRGGVRTAVHVVLLCAFKDGRGGVRTAVRRRPHHREDER